MRLTTLLAYPLILGVAPVFAVYSFVKEYSGSSFFSDWDFGNGTYDRTTHGHVNYLTEADAMSQNLTYINDAGHAVIRVDDFTTVIWENKRNSVRIQSNDFFPIGSVIVFDATHVPFGCSVWPGFWTKGPNWPLDGEIDIVESVNLLGHNQMSLHTLSGCNQPSSVKQLGQTIGTDCSAGADSATGCGVAETQPKSFGADFVSAGGGVWATQFDVSGVYIWFWTRKDVPDSVTNAQDSIDTSSWGTPSAAWPSASCNITKYFAPQQLVIDITLCGDWAGIPSLYQSMCGGPLGNGTYDTCYLQNVINTNGSNYADAYFEIASIKVFTVNETVLTPTLSGSSTVLTTATGFPSGPGTNSSGSDSGNAKKGSSNGSLGRETMFGSATVYVSTAATVVLAALSLALL
ncbi:concanavalin A-like lectin/glucanase domain-containing protein [Cubamyces menziesii]|uniref:GH16 domain-containing protein n=1 Tax=Trametes cubensis TaxID=1111947 RepID=A0AAD7U2U7_9APHY|nr:concanavalin A-like lectin/glucanase domain-containing protein [Cubamyces menziesii]KAJ8497069.1 hypothetical protein ONZ51_g747 [Trametes cubensis]